MTDNRSLQTWQVENEKDLLLFCRQLSPLCLVQDYGIMKQWSERAAAQIELAPREQELCARSK